MKVSFNIKLNKRYNAYENVVIAEKIAEELAISLKLKELKVDKIIIGSHNFSLESIRKKNQNRIGDMPT